MELNLTFIGFFAVIYVFLDGYSIHGKTTIQPGDGIGVEAVANQMSLQIMSTDYITLG